MFTRHFALALALALVACGSGSPAPDGGTDAGTDGGMTGPIAAPLLRLGDQKDGTSHMTTYQGVVVSNQPPTQLPSWLGTLTPADDLSVQLGSGQPMDLYYTMPSPFRLALHPQDQIKVTWAELAAGNVSSYGLRVNSLLDGSFKLLVEDGELGSAFTNPSDRLDFNFMPDTQPTGQEPDPCGMKVHFPALVTQGQQTRRLFPGQAMQFSLADGSVVTFTLFDLWKITGDTCGTTPDFSIAYFVQPSM